MILKTLLLNPTKTLRVGGPITTTHRPKNSFQFLFMLDMSSITPYILPGSISMVWIRSFWLNFRSIFALAKVTRNVVLSNRLKEIDSVISFVMLGFISTN